MDNKEEFFESAMRGLGEVVEHAKGERELRASFLIVNEPKIYTPEEICAIRQKHNLSQALAADIVGVSKKAWETWEYGTIKPPPPVARLLHILDNHFELLWEMGIISRETAVSDKDEEA